MLGGGRVYCAIAGPATKPAAAGKASSKAPENRIIVHPRQRSSRQTGPLLAPGWRHIQDQIRAISLTTLCFAPSGFLGFGRQNLLCDAVTVHRGREPAINGY